LPSFAWLIILLTLRVKGKSDPESPLKYQILKISEAVGNFLYRLPDFEEKLNEYHAADNNAIKAKLGEFLENNCRLVKAFHFRRKK